MLVVGAAGPLAYAVGHPAYSTGDEMAHVDYAYQVWLGRFPVFEDGLLLQTDVGFRPSIQWVAQHPPLFYALLAPIVGPTIGAEHPVVAVMLARGALSVMAALSVLGVRWMVRGAFPSSTTVPTAAALVYALSSWFPRQGGSIYNDLPAVLAVTIAMGMLFRALRSPSSRRWILGMALALSLASLVRFSTLPLAAGLVAALVVHRVVVLRRAWRAAAETSALALSIVLASGWWWLRNLRLTGNLQGSQAEYWTQARGWETRGLGEIVLDDQFWFAMMQQLFSTTFMRPREPWVIWGWLGIALLFLAPVLVGVLALVADRWRGRREAGAGTEVIVALTLIGVLATVIATQVSYSMSSGSALPRYFFALVPSSAALMAYAFARWRSSILVLLAWIVVRLGALGLELRSTIDRPLRGSQADLYPTVVWVCFAVLLTATIGLAVLLVDRHRSTRSIPASSERARP